MTTTWIDSLISFKAIVYSDLNVRCFVKPIGGWNEGLQFAIDALVAMGED